MAKKTLHHPQKALLKGVDELCDAVSVTLGPYGKNVVLYRELNPPYSTKDGVTVAREITFSDPVKHMGAEMVKQASIETATQAGDGTTTTLVLAQSILKNALGSTINSNSLKKEIDACIEELIEYIKPEFTLEDNNYLELISKVATISANNDKVIGNLITDVYKDLGKDAILSIAESKTGETYTTKVPGMRFDNGWQHFKFVTNEVEMICEMENPLILITDYAISDVKKISEILQKCIENNRPLLIIAEEVSPLVTKMLVAVKTMHKIPMCTVKAPAMNIRRTEMLKDIAALTGGTLISRSYGKSINKVTLDDLGKAGKVVLDRLSTSIIEGKGSQEEIQARIDNIDHLMKEVQTTETMHYKKKLQERKASLSSGMAILHVGGSSEIEMRELKDRVDDAVCAVRAALEDGVCYGGGSVYYKLSHLLEFSRDKLNNGELILFSALQEPFKKIWKNANLDVYEKAMRSKNYKQYNDYLKENGVLDPVKVLKQALYNAASIATLILITDCVIYNDAVLHTEVSEYDSIPTLDIDMTSKEDDGAI